MASGQLFSRTAQALFYNYKQLPIQRMLDFDFLCGRETPSVAGIINPGSKGFQKLFFGQEEIAIPVHSTIEAACAAHPTADVFINFASFRSAAASSMSALKQPFIRVVAIIAEEVPESDTKQLIGYARTNNKVVIGPATVGGIQAGAFKFGDTAGTIDNIIQCKLYRPGSVGFVSKSGGISNKMYNTIARVTDGIYKGIAIGGDVFPGSTLSNHVLRFNNIPQWCCRGRFYFSSKTETTAQNEEDEEQESEVKPTSSCIIEERDLLRKSPNSGLYILSLIDNGAVDPNPSLYNKILRRCTQLGKLREGRTVHSHLAGSRRLAHDLVVQNTVLNMYAKCGSVDEARKVFDEMPERDFVTYTSLITGFAQNDRPIEGLALFPEMVRSGLRPNEFTFSSLLKAAGAVSSERDGRQLHGFVYRYGFYTNVYVGSSLVDMYARCGLMDEAKIAFNGLVSKNEVSWNGLIAGHVRKGEGENAIGLFVEMQRENFRPTIFTYSSIFGACASCGALEQGKWVHAHMLKSGEKLVNFIGNTLLDMYAKSGSIEDARKVFNRLLKRDIVSWNSMLSACAQHGLGEETVKKFEEMVKIGIIPNVVTFLCAITACSHAGLLEQGKHYFDLMKKYGIEQEVSHYVTIVDLFGRAGELDRAKGFIENMSIEPTAAVWGALLGASRMHKNIEMGAYAAEHIFELDPHDSGPYVILYNMYVSAGRLNDAARVRKLMRENGVKKEPACSWVEIENSVHMFVANDDAHPMRKKIFKKWEEMSKKIKEIGYVPDASHSLSFVDQEEREAKLQYHSEKLALAFALISTPRGSTIRVKKNIRVCGDCHSAFKFISKAEERKIVLRDKNRFHHFSNGVCSCGDYW